MPPFVGVHVEAFRWLLLAPVIESSLDKWVENPQTEGNLVFFKIDREKYKRHSWITDYGI